MEDTSQTMNGFTIGKVSQTPGSTVGTHRLQHYMFRHYLYLELKAGVCLRSWDGVRTVRTDPFEK